MRVVGLILIVLGLIGLAYGGITWTNREKVVDLGPIEVTRTEHERIPLPPLVGGISVLAGVAIIFAGRRRA